MDRHIVQPLRNLLNDISAGKKVTWETESGNIQTGTLRNIVESPTRPGFYYGNPLDGFLWISAGGEYFLPMSEVMEKISQGLFVVLEDKVETELPEEDKDFHFVVEYNTKTKKWAISEADILRDGQTIWDNVLGDWLDLTPELLEQENEIATNLYAQLEK